MTELGYIAELVKFYPDFRPISFTTFFHNDTLSVFPEMKGLVQSSEIYVNAVKACSEDQC